MTKDKPKKSRRRENHETELLKDDLRVVVFHPDQQQMVRGKCIGCDVHCRKENTTCSVYVTGWAGIEGEFPNNIWNS